MIKSRVIISVCLLTILTLFIAKPAYVEACSCAGPPSVEKQFDMMSAVFSGTVVSMIDPPQKRIMSSADPVTIVFDVDKVWKGEVTESTKVYTAMGGESCGYEHFEIGQQFLVLANSTDEGQLLTGMCTATMKLSAAQHEIASLGDGYLPLKAVELPEMEDKTSLAVLWIISGILILVLGMALVVVLRMRRR